MKKFPSENWTTMQKEAVLYVHGTSDDIKYIDVSADALINGMRDKYGIGEFHIAFDNKECGNDNGISYDGIVTYDSKPLYTHVAIWHEWRDTNSVSDNITSWKSN